VLTEESLRWRRETVSSGPLQRSHRDLESMCQGGGVRRGSLEARGRVATATATGDCPSAPAGAHAIVECDDSHSKLTSTADIFASCDCLGDAGIVGVAGALHRRMLWFVLLIQSMGFLGGDEPRFQAGLADTGWPGPPFVCGRQGSSVRTADSGLRTADCGLRYRIMSSSRRGTITWWGTLVALGFSRGFSRFQAYWNAAVDPRRARSRRNSLSAHTLRMARWDESPSITVQPA
jgi:hypothetical protein